MNLFAQGLSLSVAGILVTFASLGLFILIIILLQKFFPPEQVEAQTSTNQVSTALPDMTAEFDQSTAAAIAIAIAHFQSLEAEASGIGSSLVQGPGPWWHARQYPAEPTRPRQMNRSNES